MLDPVTIVLGVAIAGAFVGFFVLRRAGGGPSPAKIRQSALSVMRAQCDKNGVDWGAVDPDIAEAIVKDAIAYATKSRRTDLVLMDDHIGTLVRIVARGPQGLPEGSIQARLWRRVTERAAALRASRQSKI